MKRTIRQAYSKIRILSVVLISFCCLAGIITHSSDFSNQATTSSSSIAPISEPQQLEYDEARIVRVVDGDTLVVTINGEDKKVRLIGIDAPESVAYDASKNCSEGTLASEYVSSLLDKGQLVYLSKDVSETDQYGRLLRYVWLTNPTEISVTNNIENDMLNAKLVAEGYAQPKKYKPNTKYAQYFEDLGQNAAKNHLGVTYKWSEA